MASIEGKVILVTGAASGIGQSTCARLCNDGAIVYGTDIADLTETEKLVADSSGSFTGLEQDVRSEDDWKRVVGQVADDHKGIDGLVNNAGIGEGGSVLDHSLSDWQRQFAINVEGVFLGTREVIPLMRDSGGGSIVNISSSAGLRGFDNLACYCGTKGAVRLFTKAVALEARNSGWNIRVNSVHPGIIDTPIWSSALDVDEDNPLREILYPDGANKPDVEGFAQLALQGHRAGVPADIAAGIRFLLSDDSDYMTGSELVIDAAITAGT